MSDCETLDFDESLISRSANLAHNAAAVDRGAQSLNASVEEAVFEESHNNNNNNATICGTDDRQSPNDDNDDAHSVSAEKPVNKKIKYEATGSLINDNATDRIYVDSNKLNDALPPEDVFQPDSKLSNGIINKEKQLADDIEKMKKTEEITGKISNIILVTNFTRPLNVVNLKKWIKENTSGYLDEKFWIDSIKSKIILHFDTSENAQEAGIFFSHKRWPESNPKLLAVKFLQLDEIKEVTNETPLINIEINGHSKKEISINNKSENKVGLKVDKAFDNLQKYFLKTNSKPYLFWKKSSRFNAENVELMHLSETSNKNSSSSSRNIISNTNHSSSKKTSSSYHHTETTTSNIKLNCTESDLDAIRNSYANNKSSKSTSKNNPEGSRQKTRGSHYSPDTRRSSNRTREDSSHKLENLRQSLSESKKDSHRIKSDRNDKLPPKIDQSSSTSSVNSPSLSSKTSLESPKKRDTSKTKYRIEDVRHSATETASSNTTEIKGNPYSKYSGITEKSSPKKVSATSNKRENDQKPVDFDALKSKAAKLSKHLSGLFEVDIGSHDNSENNPPPTHRNFGKSAKTKLVNQEERNEDKVLRRDRSRSKERDVKSSPTEKNSVSLSRERKVANNSSRRENLSHRRNDDHDDYHRQRASDASQRSSSHRDENYSRSRRSSRDEYRSSHSRR